MKRFLDILLNVTLIFWLTWLFLNFFWKAPEQSQWLNITFTQSTYSVPAAPKLEVKNYTDADITLNTCNDIEIRRLGEVIVFDDSFCKDVVVAKQTIETISYADVYKNFESFWEYSSEIVVGEKKYTPTVKIENKGALSKIFSGILYAPIYNLVVWFIEIFNHSFGWGIVAVTIIIRLILMYPQHKMMVSQRKMQAIQPKMKALQEQYKDDKQQLWIKVMELYKKENVSPFGSCGILLIQMPILLVVYNIILGIQNPANTFYLYDFLKNFDVTKIDFSFFGLDLLQAGGVQGVILAVVIAVLQFTQVKLSMMFNKTDDSEKKKWVVLEKKKWENDYSQMMPDPEMMNKILLYGMPIMVAVFTYTLFAWVGIYWGIGTLFMIVQQLVVNKLIKK